MDHPLFGLRKATIESENRRSQINTYWALRQSVVADLGH